MPHIIEPVGQRAVPHGDAALAERAALHFGVPEQEEHRALLQEEGVRAVIDVLPAEVPEVDPRRLLGAIDRKWEFFNLDAMCASDLRGVGGILAAFEAVAQVRLADAAVAEDEDLEFGVVFSATLKVRVVRILSMTLWVALVSADFSRQVVEGCSIQVQSRQCRQQYP